MNLEETIRATLPTFPPELVSEWLVPCARRNGWPPAKRNLTWDRVLLYIPLQLWENAVWTAEDRKLEWEKLGSFTKELVEKLLRTYLYKTDSLPPGQLNDGQKRFKKAKEYLLLHGVFPARIAVLQRAKGFMDVADGYHRVTAYFAVRPPPTHSNSPAVGNVLGIQTEQPMWVARL